MAAIPNLDPPRVALLDELATPLMLLDRAGVVRYANAACASWLGVSARRLLDRPAAELDSSGTATLSGLVARALAEGGTFRAARVRISAAAGVEHYADASATALPAALAPHACALELHAVAEFPGADPALELPAALTASLKGLAHEVKNPLAGLRGAAQLLVRRVVDSDAQRYLAVIIAEADRLSALVDRLLDPAPPRPFAPVNVHEVLERVRLLAEAEAGWAVVVQRDYDPSLPLLSGDADRLAQALWNLIRNALESGSSEVRLRTRAEHNVTIGAEPVRVALRLEVIDNGRGVPEDLGNRVFLPLVSGRADGTGLGLPVAQEVAREHGGALSFRSRPGHTVFTLLLPLAEG
ncbi:MAG TPA: nitrogen regulation protein NR(II) [Candidatus Saccharimonadia bacterium]|nr:nitrogen regulation protein NR(II) [Candidatus Saccharimonadia bacterium]